jgi:hypothetical protein
MAWNQECRKVEQVNENFVTIAKREMFFKQIKMSKKEFHLSVDRKY